MKNLTAALLTLLAFLTLAACSAETEKGTADQEAGISPRALEAHMRFLADDLLEGRGTGSRGYDIAARYVESRLRGLGLAPLFAGSYRQPVPMRESVAVEGSGALTLTRDGTATPLRADEDFLVFASSRETTTRVGGDVVFAGFGVVAEGRAYDDYAGLDTKGRIVAILDGAPAQFPSDERAYYSSGATKAAEAARHGAIGMIIIMTPDSEKRYPWAARVASARSGGVRWLDKDGQPAGSAPAIRATAMLSPGGAARLFGGTDGLAAAIEAAADGSLKARDLGVSAAIAVDSTRRDFTSLNVGAMLKGADPALADRYVVYSAHLDHLGIRPPINGDSINNGAYDNASGTAMLLEIAARFAHSAKRPRRSIIFVSVTGEEKGLRGSDYFASNPPVAIDKIVADVNMDMLLMQHPVKDIVAFGATHSSLGAITEKAAAAMGITVSPDPFPELVVFIRSDHYSFVRKGIPAISLFPGFNTGDPSEDGKEMFEHWMATTYHKPGDDMNQKFDFDAGATIANLNYRIGRAAADGDAAPNWVAGDFFGRLFGPGRMAAAGANH